MRVMKIVGRANRDVIDALTTPPQLVDMTIEALEFGEKMCLGKVAVYNADRVLRIEGHREIATDSFYGMHVARRDVACGPDKCEQRHPFP